MKRAKAPQMFSHSDSESDDAPASTRFKPSSTPQHFSNTLSSPFKHYATSLPCDQPDSLDAFMSTLEPKKSTPAASHAWQSSKDAVVTSSEDETSAVGQRGAHQDEIQTSPHHTPPNLSLQPVDYKSHPPPLVNRLSFTPPPHLPKDASTIRARLEIMNASIRNGTAPIITLFSELCPPVPKQLIQALIDQFPCPTPVQSLSLPYTLSSRDVVATAQTGSGKTIAFALPLLSHVAAQSGSSRAGRGPAALVVAPTRELSIQIAQVINDYGRTLSITAYPVVGGVPKYDQYKQIRDGGAAVLVCTPGRLIDMLRMRACRLSRCSFVVLDEADRILDMGFDAQLRMLLSQIRPDAQRALFSATMPNRVQSLVADILNDPVHISLTGGTGAHPRSAPMVNENVNDAFLSFDSDSDRQQWFVDHLPPFVQQGLIIVFCATRGDAAGLANVIRAVGIPAACIHGETEQSDREGLLRLFRSGEVPLLVTTDLSARGLDIDDVRNVVNYGCAKTWEWHVHRVGRTGRAAQTGNAYTLIDCSSQGDVAFASQAAAILRREKREIPTALMRFDQRRFDQRNQMTQHVRKGSVLRGKGTGRRPHKSA